MPYSKKEDKKTIKQLDKLAKKENLKTGIAYLSNISSMNDEKRLKSQEKNKNEKNKNK